MTGFADLDQIGYQDAIRDGESPAVVLQCIQSPDVVLVVAWADPASCFSVYLEIHRYHRNSPKQATRCASWHAAFPSVLPMPHRMQHSESHLASFVSACVPG